MFYAISVIPTEDNNLASECFGTGFFMGYLDSLFARVMVAACIVCGRDD